MFRSASTKTVPATAQLTSALPSKLTVYFSLALRKPTTSEDQSDSPLLYEFGGSGSRVYEIYVRSHLNKIMRDHHWHTEQTCTGDGILQLRCFKRAQPGEICSSVTIPVPTCPVMLTNLGTGDNLSHPFLIELPEQYGTEELVFQLFYKKSAKPDWDLIASLGAKLLGYYNCPNYDLFHEMHIAAGLNEHLLEDSCTFYVTKGTDDDTFRLVCWGHALTNPEPHIEKQAFIKLVDLADAKKYNTATMLDLLRNYSRNGPRKLLNWLSLQYDHAQQHSRTLRVLIHDSTPYETPWEALILTVREGKEYFLGAIAHVARWKHFYYYDTDRYYDTHTMNTFCNEAQSASILAYLDRGELERYSEQSALETLTSPITSINDFKQCLSQSLSDIRLVYIGAHGEHGEQVGSRQNLSERISRLQLEGPRPAGEISHPIFFVNACYSAFLTIRDTGPQKDGLLDVIMAHMACGYIGTLGEVSHSYAAQIAKSILIKAQQPGGVLIPEILRHFRAKAVKEIHSDTFQQLTPRQKTLKYKNLFYAFMYVYYGNLQARLYLQPATPEQKEQAS